MAGTLLSNKLLEDSNFWASRKQVVLPAFNRTDIPVRSLCFSAGRMAYGHTGDILQDVLDKEPQTGLMAGIETFAARHCADLSACDFLTAQVLLGNGSGDVSVKIQGALNPVVFVDDNRSSMTWERFIAMARDPGMQFGTINAPEGAYGMVWNGGEFAEPMSAAVKEDMSAGTVKSDVAKWTAFALERYKSNLKFALVSCTNFSSNGMVTGATVRTMARAWEEKGFAPKGFTGYLSDPSRFSFPNCMIDRIAVSPDAKTAQILDGLGIISPVVVTEQTRYWAVEDLFPAGRPRFELAQGVFMEPTHADVKKYEDMKLRILNMCHSLIAGLGVLLGYRGPYAIYRAMQDPLLRRLMDRIIDVVVSTVSAPSKMNPRQFANDTIARLNNANIPDDPMRIALNGSTKMKPRFLDTYFAGLAQRIPPGDLDAVLLPVAGFLRYTLGTDDAGEQYALENDPVKEMLVKAGGSARIGDPSSSAAFKGIISDANIMGKDLYAAGTAGLRIQEMTGRMLAGKGAVREELARMVGTV